MPAAISHHLFGEQVLAAFDYERFNSFDEHDAFMLGCQGPDPLYYLFEGRNLVALHLLGTRMHRENVNRELEVMRSFSDSMGPRQREIAHAYFCGFLSHFMLDSTTHPLINAQVREITSAGVPGLDGSASSEVHGQIEADLDSMMLWRLKETDIVHFRPFQMMLWASSNVLGIIDKLFRYVAASVYHIAMKPGTYKLAVHDMRVGRRVMWSPLGVKRMTLGAIERVVRPHSLIQAMSNRPSIHETCDFANDEHREWKSPSTRQTSNESFGELFDKALANTLEAIKLGEEGAPIREITHDLNFVGIPSVVI